MALSGFRHLGRQPYSDAAAHDAAEGGIEGEAAAYPHFSEFLMKI